MPSSVTYHEFESGRESVRISSALGSQAPTATIARTMYSGGGEVQFSFSSKQTKYIVYSRVVRTGPDGLGRWIPEIQNGVAHYIDGKFNGIRSCKVSAGLNVVNDTQLDKYFQPGKFIYVQLEEI